MKLRSIVCLYFLNVHIDIPTRENDNHLHTSPSIINFNLTKMKENGGIRYKFPPLQYPASPSFKLSDIVLQNVVSYYFPA